MLSEKSTFNAFLEAAKGKRVIGFGATRFIPEIAGLLSDNDLAFDYLVDNDFWRWGSVHCGIPVRSVGELYDEKLDEIVVLICLNIPFGIEKQLDAMGITDCYAYCLWADLVYRRTGNPIPWYQILF